MADAADLWRRALTANGAYYRAVGGLYREYGRAVAAVLRGGSAPSQAAPTPAPALAPARPRPSAMALEASAGSVAAAAFLVENRSRERVSAPIEMSALVDPEGSSRTLAPVFEPAVATLDPGEQLLVQVTIPVGRTLRTGVDYRGEVHVAGLEGQKIPVVVRRLRAARSRGTA